MGLFQCQQQPITFNLLFFSSLVVVQLSGMLPRRLEVSSLIWSNFSSSYSQKDQEEWVVFFFSEVLCLWKYRKMLPGFHFLSCLMNTQSSGLVSYEPTWLVLVCSPLLRPSFELFKHGLGSKYIQVWAAVVRRGSHIVCVHVWTY